MGGAEVGAIAAELLALRGSLTPTQAQLVLEHDAHNPGYHQLRLNAELVKWLAGDIDLSLQRVLVESLEKGLTLLDAEDWESSYHYALTYLVFALAYWVLTGQTTELSVRIFLLGLKSAFLEQGPTSEGLRADTLAAIEPLFGKGARRKFDRERRDRQRQTYGSTLCSADHLQFASPQESNKLVFPATVLICIFPSGFFSFSASVRGMLPVKKWEGSERR